MSNYPKGETKLVWVSQSLSTASLEGKITFSIKDGASGPIFSLDRKVTAFVDLTGDNFKKFIMRFRVVLHPEIPSEDSFIEKTLESPGQFIISGVYSFEGVAVDGTANGTVLISG